MRAQRASPGIGEHDMNEPTTNGRARTQRTQHERASANPTNPTRTGERGTDASTTNGERDMNAINTNDEPGIDPLRLQRRTA